eukprot:TRINITY_DN5182_c0_g1_i6.p1 TRINITY_DN5182_c0_g1~~TRINITY_DN5182_c0_g1_i6.p1  ORF type:complete len:260 (+),score=30.97 TRINITY_DN5182_c0_g1_i6:37-780(+)
MTMGICCNFCCFGIFTTLEAIVIIAAAIALATPFWLDPDYNRNIPVITDGNKNDPKWVNHAGFWQVCGYKVASNETTEQVYEQFCNSTKEETQNWYDELSDDAKEQWDKTTDYFRGDSDCTGDNLEQFWGRWWDYVNASRIISIIFVGLSVFKMVSINCGICKRQRKRDFDDDKSSRGPFTACGSLMAFLQVACGLTVIGLMVAVCAYISNDTCNKSYDDTVKYIGWSLWLWVAAVGLGMLTSFFLC